MKVHGNSSQAHCLVLISLTLLLCYFIQPTLASPFGQSSLIDTQTEQEPSLHNLTFSAHAPNQRRKRDDKPKGIRFEATCNPALQRYLLSSFGEARTQVCISHKTCTVLICVHVGRASRASPQRFDTDFEGKDPTSGLESAQIHDIVSES